LCGSQENIPKLPKIEPGQKKSSDVQKILCGTLNIVLIFRKFCMLPKNYADVGKNFCASQKIVRVKQTLCASHKIIRASEKIVLLSKKWRSPPKKIVRRSIKFCSQTQKLSACPENRANVQKIFYPSQKLC
jgi:hypothetical protein